MQIEPNIKNSTILGLYIAALFGWVSDGQLGLRFIQLTNDYLAHPHHDILDEHRAIYTAVKIAATHYTHSAARCIACGGEGDRAALHAAFSRYTFVDLLTVFAEGQSEHKNLSQMATCHLVEVLLLISKYAAKISSGKRSCI